MGIMSFVVRLAEKITGRKCSRCDHNRGGRCCHPNGETFCRCWQSITRPGFEHIQENEPGDMTQEEKHQLEKIVESLQEASATAKDCGLLGDSFGENRASGLLEED